MKTSKAPLTILLLLSIFLLSCSKDDSGTVSNFPTKETNGVFLQEINTETLVQYTPDLSPWEKFENLPLESFEPYNPIPLNSHALTDSRLMTEEDWDNNYWDGNPFNPEKLTREQLHAAMFPNQHNIMIGLKQLYERHKPFEDEKKPTKAEVDEWNRLVINHFRALCGYGAEKYKVYNSHMLYIRTLWSDEVKFTDKWDNFYYRNGDNVIDDKSKFDYLNRSHYGFGFIPPPEEQEEYFPPGITPTCCLSGSPEGVSGVRKWQPWSTKLSIVLGRMIKLEGFWGGHLGPLWRREKIGISYYKGLPRGGTDDRWVQVRLLYHGETRELLYRDPDGENGKMY